MIQIDFHQTLCSLTSVLDFVGVDEVQHGKRVALMADAMARELGWSDADAQFVFYGGMLHDCGVSRSEEHRCLTHGLVWEGSEAHCRQGERYLLDCPPLAQFAPLVRWHHTDWATLSRLDLDERTRRLASLIFLADRIDVLQAPYLTDPAREVDVLCAKDAIIATIRQHSGTLFDPHLVTVFQTVAERESFWLAMDPYYLIEDVEHYPRAASLQHLDGDEVLSIARLFARIVDAKSHFTIEHSERVAAIARYLLQCQGGTEDHLNMIEIAGLLHDVGKLRVADEIIEKPGPLTAPERALVTRHSYDTYRILTRVFPGTPIATWAASHHENLQGTGYPFHLQAAAIDAETRIISVADVFQAFAQDRPYRGRLSQAEVVRRLQSFADHGHLDPGVVALAIEHQDPLYALATVASLDPALS